MRHQAIIVSLIASAVTLSACTTFGGNQRTATATPPPNPNAVLNGRWIPTDEAARGIYVADFSNGQFVSKSPDTGKPIASGTYSVTPQNTVELDFVGAASERRTKATCQRTTPTTLNCVPTTGGPFNLQRTGTS